MNVVREIKQITEKELAHGIVGGISSSSWHEKYKNSAWVFVGGLSFELSEGDVICVMSQWGEVEDINLVRDKVTNKPMGFAFIKYCDWRSTVLAVDNFNGIELLQRTLRVDHVDQYRLPKEVREREEALLDELGMENEVKIGPGHAYKHKSAEMMEQNGLDISKGVNVWKPATASVVKKPTGDTVVAGDGKNSNAPTDSHDADYTDEDRNSRRRSRDADRHGSKRSRSRSASLNRRSDHRRREDERRRGDRRASSRSRSPVDNRRGRGSGRDQTRHRRRDDEESGEDNDRHSSSRRRRERERDREDDREPEGRQKRRVPDHGDDSGSEQRHGGSSRAKEARDRQRSQSPSDGKGHRSSGSRGRLAEPAPSSSTSSSSASAATAASGVTESSVRSSFGGAAAASSMGGGGGAVFASWRGRRDPNMAAAAAVRPPMNAGPRPPLAGVAVASSTSTSGLRGEMTYGGMNRRR